jgi:hypothetical protein
MAESSRPTDRVELSVTFEFSDSKTREDFELALRDWLKTYEQSLAGDDTSGYVFDGPSIIDDPLAPDVPGMPGLPPYKRIRIGWPAL